MTESTENAASDPNASASAPSLSYAIPSTPSAEHHAAGSGMTRGDVAGLAVRLLGIYVGLQGLSILTLIFRVGFRIEPYSIILLLLLAIFEGVAIASIVWAGRIGLWLLPQSSVQPADFAGVGWPLELQAVAFSVVGVIMVSYAVPNIALILWEEGGRGLGSLSHGITRDYVTEFLRPVLELVIGIWLFFGAKRLSLYWRRTRAHRPELHDESSPL